MSDQGRAEELRAGAAAPATDSTLGWVALRRYLEVVRALAGRDFRSRHRANRLGLLPTIAVPLVFLAAYSFVFTTLIPVRLRPDASRADYAFFLFSGLIAWNLFAESVLPAARIYVDRAHFVRKALFPASALPVSTALAALYRSLVWLGVFAAAALWRAELPVAALLAAPLVLAAVALLAAGVGLLVAAAGAHFRDLGELTAPLLTVGFFLAPVLVPAERLAAVAPALVWAHPMAPALRCLHALLLAGAAPEPAWIAGACAWSLGGLALGFAVHRLVRPGLGDRV